MDTNVSLWADEAVVDAMALAMGGGSSGSSGSGSSGNSSGAGSSGGNSAGSNQPSTLSTPPTSSTPPSSSTPPTPSKLSDEVKAARRLVSSLVDRSRRVYGLLYAAIPEDLRPQVAHLPQGWAFG